MTRASSSSVSSTVSMTPTAVNGVAIAAEMTVRTRRGIESGDSTDNTDDTSLTSVNSSNEGGRTASLRYNTHSEKVVDAKDITKPTSNSQDSCEAPHLVPVTAILTNRDRDRDRDRNATSSITNNYASTFLFPLLPVPRSASKSAHTKSKSIENYNYNARSGTPPQQPTSLPTTSPKLTLDTSCESQSIRAPQLTPKRKLAVNAPQ